MKVLTCKIGVETFALDVKKIQKVVESPELYLIPFAPSFFLGAINFHNHVIPVLDLAVFLGIFVQERDTRVIVLDTEKYSLGFSVSSIENFSDLEEVQSLPATLNSVFSSVSHLVSANEGESIRILDPADLEKSLESYMSFKGRNGCYLSEPIPFAPWAEKGHIFPEETTMQSASPVLSLLSKPKTTSR